MSWFPLVCMFPYTFPAGSRRSEFFPRFRGQRRNFRSSRSDKYTQTLRGFFRRFLLPLGKCFEKKITEIKMEKDLALAYNYAPPLRKGKDGRNPLLVMAHGYGADENDLFSMAAEFPDVFHVAAPRAPLDLPFGGAAWYGLDYAGDKMVSDIPQALASRDRLAQFIRQAVRKYDASRVWLLGFSQGAILSYGILSRYPDLVQRYIPLSGYIEPGVVAPDASSNDYAGVKALAMHGTQDPVIPIAAGRGVQDFLKNLGVDFRYYEFPTGHGIAWEGLSRLRQWTDETLQADGW